MADKKPNIVILISGRGSNMKSIVNAINAGS
ncbi:MAG: phosphoribosylglycinamide formyltransferase, partial [Proteobacteria bacterium]|nr:phosphoribosylglycinamide formyltransferase [Pseudomonadota bacterium]